MIRKLKALTAALVAVAALGAVVASGAQAAARFTAPGAGAGATTTLTSTLDGTGKQAHGVFDITSGGTILSITCGEGKLTNASAVGPEVTSVSGTGDAGGAIEGCKFAGQPVTINTGACAGIANADGSGEIVDDGTQVAGMHCAHTETPITFEISGCKVEIGAQKFPTGSAKYTNIKPGAVEEITVQTVGQKGTGVEEVVVNATGVACNFGTGKFGTFTTGNAIITGERGGVMVNIKWDAT